MPGERGAASGLAWDGMRRWVTKLTVTPVELQLSKSIDVVFLLIYEEAVPREASTPVSEGCRRRHRCNVSHASSCTYHFKTP
jgi:hypothetical protein